MNRKPSPYALKIDDKVLYDPIPGTGQVDFLTAPETNVFLWGNRGGGKSITARSWCHGEAMAHPGLIYYIVRKSFPELTKNHLIYLDYEMKLFGGKYNKSEHICFYPNNSIGFYAQCASDSDVTKVVGAEAAIVVFDEAPELEWEWLRLIGASVRVKSDANYIPRVRYLGNPIGPSIDQLWSYFIDKDVDRLEDPEYFPDDWRAIELRMEDNVHLNVEAYKKQFAGIPAHIRQAWVDGIRVVDGAYFVVDPKIHHVKEKPPLYGHVDPITCAIHPRPRIYRAIDWGWHDQAVCLWIAKYPNGRAIVFRELVKTHTNPKEFARLIKSMSEDVQVSETFCDPSMFPPEGQDDIRLAGNILEDNGVPLTKSRNDRVAAGYAISSWMNTPLSDGLPALQFYPPGCPVLTKTLPSMRMDKNNKEKIADSSKDHATITLSYFCFAHTVTPNIAYPGPDPTRVSNLLKNVPRVSTPLTRLGVRR